MDSANTNALILGKLEDLSKSQTEIEKNISTILERVDQRDRQYSEHFADIKTDIKKGYDGRTVLHQKQDELEKKIREIEPTIKTVNGVLKGGWKLIGGAVVVFLIAVFITVLPNIIEVIK